MNQIVTIEEKNSIAEQLVKSQLFGIKDSFQALALMALCEAEGLHPAQAVRDYHIVQGRPAMKADAMLARFQQAGGKVNWVSYTDEKVVGMFSHPQGGSITVDWTIDRAKRAGLSGRDNWKNYPRNMMRARCISEAIRAIYPGIAVGVYTPEEIQDMPTQTRQTSQEIDMGGVELVLPSPWTPELSTQADEAARSGMTAYTQWWRAQSNEFRLSAVKTNEHAAFKILAEESGA